MNCQVLPLRITLHRPWWARLADAIGERWSPGARARRGACIDELDYASLAGLSAGTLRDIGAPGWIAERRESARTAELDLMRL